MSTELQVKLELVSFDGPLDLLLHLVKEEKIEIKDIFVSQVTAQFLEYMTQLDTLDVEKASEYVDMAATLLEIKSRSLLPTMPGFDNLFDNPEKMLIRQLEEYKLFKEVSEKLKQGENVNRLFKQPDLGINAEVLKVKDVSLNNLLDAFANIMHKFEVTRTSRRTPRLIKKDSYTVADKIKYIKQRLLDVENVKFSQLFDADVTRTEVIVTFIAMLELEKNQSIVVEQTELFDDINIYKFDNFYGEMHYEESN
ncbi:MAG: segregation/condensation protein A [Clostridia bacterium]|nr:segregation/condensation protein A [Clostridia bacterium]